MRGDDTDGGNATKALNKSGRSSLKLVNEEQTSTQLLLLRHPAGERFWGLGWRNVTFSVPFASLGDAFMGGR
jgi:hypothetical protein